MADGIVRVPLGMLEYIDPEKPMLKATAEKALQVEYHDWHTDGGYFKPKEDQRDIGFTYPNGFVGHHPRGYAIIAIKRELLHLGYHELNIPLAYYGTAMAKAVRKFQEDSGLRADGEIGERTMAKMLRPRTIAWERGITTTPKQLPPIPNRLACKTIKLESADYPAAWNSGGDFWLSQMHNPADNPDLVSRIGVNVKFTCDRLRASYKTLLQFKQPEELTWRAAVASHNAPALADDWLRAGCPPDGGPEIWVGTEDNIWDAWVWLDLYTDVVYKQDCA